MARKPVKLDIRCNVYGCAKSAYRDGRCEGHWTSYDPPPNHGDPDDRAILEALRLRRAGRKVKFVGVLAKRFDDTEANEGYLVDVRAIDDGPDPHAPVKPPGFVIEELLASLRAAVASNTDIKLTAPEAQALIDVIVKAGAPPLEYLGALSLLARCSINLRDGREESADELREAIADALIDGQKFFPRLKWKRVLDRIEVELED